MTLPATLTRTSHAVTIRANGVTVGLINGWNPTQNRTVTGIYEVGTDGSGNPVEYMPGNATGLQISVSRYDLYALKMEEAFGTPDLTMLTRQSEPFDVLEVWRFPFEVDTTRGTERGRAVIGGIASVLSLGILPAIAGAVDTPTAITKERFVYRGCWFTSLGRALRSDDNRIVNVNATLVYTQKLKVSGLSSGISRSFGLRL